MFQWSLYSPTTNFVTNLGNVGVVGLSAHMLATGKPGFTLGEFFAFFYASMFYEPVRQLNNLNNMLSEGKGFWRPSFEILDHPLTIENVPDAVKFPEGNIHVELRDVSFQYPERAPVVENLNLNMPPGTVTALVGHTGAGKILGKFDSSLYDVGSGAVCLNGTDVRQIASRVALQHRQCSTGTISL